MYFQRFKVRSMTNKMENFINELLKRLSEDYKNGKFIPISEADVVGYLALCFGL